MWRRHRHPSGQIRIGTVGSRPEQIKLDSDGEVLVKSTW